MIFNFHSLLWYLLADVVVIAAVEVFFPDFADSEDDFISLLPPSSAGYGIAESRGDSINEEETPRQEK